MFMDSIIYGALGGLLAGVVNHYGWVFRVIDDGRIDKVNTLVSKDIFRFKVMIMILISSGLLGGMMGLGLYAYGVIDSNGGSEGYKIFVASTFVAGFLAEEVKGLFANLAFPKS